MKFTVIDEYHKIKPKKITPPICPKCKKYCKPAGSNNINDPISNIWKCFDCEYTLEDIYYMSLPRTS